MESPWPKILYSKLEVPWLEQQIKLLSCTFFSLAIILIVWEMLEMTFGRKSNGVSHQFDIV